MISDSKVKKYGIPSYALKWDGINAPEGGMFISREKYPGYKVGDIIEVEGEICVVIYELDGEYIVTKFHNVPPSYAELRPDDLLPQSPGKGPPLPKSWGIKWPGK